MLYLTSLFRRASFGASIAVVSFFAVLWAVTPASAATCQFITGGSTDWNTASNWSCGAVPAPSDDVQIPANASVDVLANAVAQTLTVGSNATVIVDSGAELQVMMTTQNDGVLNVHHPDSRIVFNAQVSNFGTLIASTGTLAFQSDLQNVGLLHAGSGTILIGGQWVHSGTFQPSTGTVIFTGSGNQDLPSMYYYDLVLSKTGGKLTALGNVSVLRNVTLNSGTLALPNDSTTLSLGGDWIVNGGELENMGEVIFNGYWQSIVSTSTFPYLTIASNTTVTSPLQGAVQVEKGLSVAPNATLSVPWIFVSRGNSLNKGTIDVSGAFYSYNTFTNQGTLNNQMYFIMFGDVDSTLGTYTGNGTLWFRGGSNQTLTSAQPITARQVFVSKDPGASVSITNNVTVIDDVSIFGGTLNGGSSLWNIGGSLIGDANTAFNPQSSTVVFNSSFGSHLHPLVIGSTSTNFVPSFNVLQIDNGVGGGVTALSLGTVQKLILASGTFDLGGNVLNLAGNGTPFVLGGGTLITPTSTIIYSGTYTQVTPWTYYNLSLAPATAGNFGLPASTTVMNAFDMNALATLDIGGNTLTVPGSFVNTGRILSTSNGRIVHPAESIAFTDGAGATVASVSNPGSIFVTVQDANRNRDGQSVETMTVPVTFNAAAGGDSETLTLTETGVATGIFRNTTGMSVISGSASSGNGKFELSANGVATATYTDVQDSADVTSTTMGLTHTSQPNPPVTTGGGSSGGSGGGSVGANSYIPYVPYVAGKVLGATDETPALLSHLQSIGVAVHALVKLPDDGKSSTQEDSAVYYIGADGKRHAFPNDKVYFTWYTDFSQVRVVSASTLASIRLGKNVTYRPGAKMVKFLTDPKVYVVDVGGILRVVKSETVASAMYGATWNKQVDDIEDTFYTNYSFQGEITNASQFDRVKVQTSVKVPGDSM